MSYYAEQLGFDGQNRPIKLTDMPAKRNADGAKTRIVFGPVEINRGHENLTLSQLFEIYSPMGKFTPPTNPKGN